LIVQLPLIATASLFYIGIMLSINAHFSLVN